MSDLISRKAAIDALGDIHPLDYNLQAVLEKIKALPSAKDIDVSNKVRKEKRGRWVDATKEVGWPEVKCSVCGRSGRGDYLVCPWCGAKMEGEEG